MPAYVLERREENTEKRNKEFSGGKLCQTDGERRVIVSQKRPLIFQRTIKYKIIVYLAKSITQGQLKSKIH